MQLQVSDELNLVIKYAREEAMRTGSYGIGPDHLFLGLIRQEENGRYKRNSSGFRPVLTRPGMTPKSRHRIHQATGTRLEVPSDGHLDGSYM